MLNPEDNWPALTELTQMTPGKQRRVLRLHQEAGFEAESGVAAFRSRLDNELQIIGLRELGAQTDPVNVQQRYYDIPQFAILLKKSPAFAQYLNYYYYFSVRFAAGRMSDPCCKNASGDCDCPRQPEDCNEPIIGFPTPPLCPDVWKGPLEFVRFTAETAAIEQLDKEAGGALQFLDDFVRGPDEPKSEAEASEAAEHGEAEKFGDSDERRDFELWLRDLYTAPGTGGRASAPDAAEKRFRGLSQGLLKWAANRCRFYLSLERGGSKDEWLAKWSASEWKEGRFQVNNPLSSRCALVDFYWLARILRADVSPRGEVSYRGHSWLYLLAMKRRPLVGNVAELDNFIKAGQRQWTGEEREELKKILEQAATEDPVSEETTTSLIRLLYRGVSPPDAGTQHWRQLLRLLTRSFNDETKTAIVDAISAEAGPAGCLGSAPLSRASAHREILRMEEVLRAVFVYACDLVQNAVEKAEYCDESRNNPSEYPVRPAATKSWRPVYDRELREIADQRREWRSSGGPPSAESRGSKCEESADTDGWSRRIWTGESVHNISGIAFSGGGIRSATFNLGVLQQLQELDLLRHVDYLSTVSGGGYIGAWLIGNVRRTRYWLSRLTSWDKSIEHLRRYSNYLAPENGLLRADSWTMWGTWIRNAFLIQLTGFSWMAFFLVSVLALQSAFLWSGSPAGRAPAQWVLSSLLTLIALILGFYLWQLSKPYRPPKPGSLESFRVWALDHGEVFAKSAAGLAWIASFISAGLLWGQANDPNFDFSGYKSILFTAWIGWPKPMIVVFVLALWFLAFSCFRPRSGRGAISRALWPLVIALTTSATAYLTLCGLLRLFGAMGPLDCFIRIRGAEWYAFAFGPPVALGAVTLAVVVFIGLLGRDSAEWNREWWTRYGSWIAMFGAAALILTVAAVFAPYWLYLLYHLPGWQTLKVGTVAGWVGSVIGGLLAGKSSRTGKDGSSSHVLEWAARVGGLLFIVGAVALVSTVIFIGLSEIILGSLNFQTYWDDLTKIALPAAANWEFWVILGALFLLSLLFSDRFDLNTFSLNQFYRNRLVRCYLGATRWQPGKRHPHRFTAFDMADDIDLACLTVTNDQFCGESFRGPFPIVNCTLNLGGSSDLTVHTRQSAPFTLTPLFCGSPRDKLGYIPTAEYAGKVTLGQAISVSGAAASPNMGYNTSPLVSFLLTMFNVRLGWWFPNPGTSASQGSGSLSAFYLLRELFGTADERRSFVNVSDGGHFENLGIYELVRRRASVIIAADAESDENMTFGSLGNVIRICETDFGARIEMDVLSLRKQKDTGMSQAHCAVGRIVYSNGSIGYLIYIKSSLTGDEDVGVSQYQAGHPSFPHESTADQFFSEDQFEAYRRLGYHITERAFRGAANEPPELYAIGSKLFDLWVPAAFSNEAFQTSAKAYDAIWDRFRTDTRLAALFSELTGTATGPGPVPPALLPPTLQPEELTACMELLQLMENVFIELRLDDFWDHPDNRGWAMLFTTWAQSAKFREAWATTRHTFGIRFEYFCNLHLGLMRDKPVMRI